MPFSPLISKYCFKVWWSTISLSTEVTDYEIENEYIYIYIYIYIYHKLWNYEIELKNKHIYTFRVFSR